MYSFLELFGGPLLWQYVAVIIANLSCLCTGMGVAWTSPVLVKLRNTTETVLDRPITEDEGSWLVSIGLITGIVANFVAMHLVDLIGRKHCITVTNIIRVVTNLLLTFGTEVWVLLLGRALSGIADSFSFFVVPIYASEIASKEVRGSLGTFLQLFASLGVVTMLCMGPFLHYFTLNVVYLIICILSCLPLPFVPESPYYLYATGRNDDALKVLISLRGSEDIAIEEIKEYSISKTDEKPNKMKLFTDIVFLKALFIGVVLGVGLQLSGFNAVTFYLQTILESTQTSVRSEIASVILGLIQMVAAICTTFIIDRFGRKQILSFTLIGMTLGMVGLGTFFKLRENSTGSIDGALNYLPLTSLILVVFCFSAGLGALAWLIIPEIFDGPGRSVGSSISLIISIGSLFITAKYFVNLINSLGPASTYWLFSVNCLILNVFIMFFMPETKGKTISEIQKALGRRVNNIDRTVEKC